MSYYFEVSGETVWDPSLRIGKWYLSFAEAAAELVQRPTGLTPSQDDTCAVDIQPFQHFVQGLLDCYASTRHPVQHGLVRGVLLASLVILARGGGVIVPKTEREASLMEEVESFARSM
ncbi:hypothetical protein ADK76_02840 [Streptomyces griseoflavus]|uniref:DUF6086 family protein n=1 Tax=Streptomyces rimosus TaxID=1927 RepID=UPI00067B4A8A|nr:DUF6086 family protein [Streptomyces rimosus]KOG66388.1 hypothetical protein ADK76_02840 [Streptomyces griseoflavus]